MGITRLHVSVFLGLAVAAWAVALWFYGIPLSWDLLIPYGSVVGVLAFLAAFFEQTLWHLRLLHGWFVKRPDLRGTWRVELVSDWVNPATGTPAAPISGFMGITQTLSTLQMHLMTVESEAWLIAERVQSSPNGVGYQVAGVYSNKPDVQLRGARSEMHRGAFVLDTHGPPHRPDGLTGEYWTDRKTCGRLALADRMPDVLTRFEDAVRAWDSRKPAGNAG